MSLLVCRNPKIACAGPDAYEQASSQHEVSRFLFLKAPHPALDAAFTSICEWPYMLLRNKVEPLPAVVPAFGWKQFDESWSYDTGRTVASTPTLSDRPAKSG